MKAGEVLRWAYRHQVDFEFKKVPEGIQLNVTTKHKAVFTQHKKLLRDHDLAADEICRFIEKIATEFNLE
jgi:hypothetical protein